MFRTRASISHSSFLVGVVLLGQGMLLRPAQADSRVWMKVLATTNCPWDLDEAIRRRLEKRIYIPLPDLASRSSMFAIHMKGVACDSTCDFEELAVLTDGYSGADVKVWWSGPVPKQPPVICL